MRHRPDTLVCQTESMQSNLLILTKLLHLVPGRLRRQIEELWRLWQFENARRTNPTINRYALLLKAVETGNLLEIRELVCSGLNVNYRLDIHSRCDDGASVLFGAVLYANLEVIRTLLELGADPNLQSIEPALTIYADTPLDVAIQARLLLDWEKYDAVVKLLIEYGAKGYDVSPEREAVIRQEALNWQKTQRKQRK